MPNVRMRCGGSCPLHRMRDTRIRSVVTRPVKNRKHEHRTTRMNGRMLRHRTSGNDVGGGMGAGTSCTPCPTAYGDSNESASSAARSSGSGATAATRPGLDMVEVVVEVVVVEVVVVRRGVRGVGTGQRGRKRGFASRVFIGTQRGVVL